MKLFGQELNLNSWAVCKMNVALHNVEANIEGGWSSLTDPQFLTPDGKIETFDLVMANFPFSDKFWGYDDLKTDPFGRFTYGIPPRKSGDFAYIQHIIASMNETARAGVVCSQGVLYRGQSEGKIRQAIVEDDLVEAVIGLPADIFHGNSIPACVLILNRRKPEGRRGKVLFVNAADGYEELPKQNRLRDDDVDRIVDAFEMGSDQDHYCRSVGMDEMADNDFVLSIPRYVDTFDSEDLTDLDSSISILERAEIERELSVMELRQRIGGLKRAK